MLTPRLISDKSMTFSIFRPYLTIQTSRAQQNKIMKHIEFALFLWIYRGELIRDSKLHFVSIFSLSSHFLGNQAKIKYPNFAFEFEYST